MNNRGQAKRINENSRKTRQGSSDPKQWDEFSMLVGMLPYRELGTGGKCKIKGCHQPVYSKESRLCSYHRMGEAERAFENRLKARQQETVGEG